MIAKPLSLRYGRCIMVSPPDGTQVPDGPQRCPKCAEVPVKAATLTDRFVYLRCATCGEVWVIPERRQLRRSGIPASR